jgi:hypothetical protein
LKSAQIDAARGAGLRFICGRNRVGGTAEMGPLNRSFGAYTVVRLTSQYGEPDGAADYYRINLYPGRVETPPRQVPELDLAAGLQRPLGSVAPSAPS